MAGLQARVGPGSPNKPPKWRFFSHPKQRNKARNILRKFRGSAAAPNHHLPTTLKKPAGSGPRKAQGTTMSLSIVHSRAQIGVDAPAVTVEVHLANGLPSLTMVGLPEAALYERYNRQTRVCLE